MPIFLFIDFANLRFNRQTYRVFERFNAAVFYLITRHDSFFLFSSLCLKKAAFQFKRSQNIKKRWFCFGVILSHHR